jgi:hypothetical protein
MGRFGCGICTEKIREILMSKAILIGLVASVISLSSASADTYKSFKGWVAKIEDNRFDDTANVMAASVQNGFVLAIRCIGGQRSVALTDLSTSAGRYAERDILLVKFRADKKPILDTGAMALDDKMIQFADTDAMMEQMAGAKELAFRLEFKGASLDRVFAAGDVSKAISLVSSKCPKKPLIEEKSEKK